MAQALPPSNDIIKITKDNFRILTASEEYELAVAWQQRGCKKSRDRIILSHLPMANKVARSYRWSAISHDDLMQEAVIGLSLALDRYDPATGFRFGTYARNWVNAGIRDHITKNRQIVKCGNNVGIKTAINNFSKAQQVVEKRARVFGQVLSTDQKDELIAAELNISIADLKAAKVHLVGFSSLNTPMGDEEGSNEIIDTIEGSGDHVSDYNNSDAESFASSVIRKSLRRLNPRELDIVLRRSMASEPATLDELAQVYGVSRERIRQLEVKAKATIKAALASHKNILLECYAS